MSLLLEGNGKTLNANNIVGRLTYGLIGLDLKTKGHKSANEYLDACASVFEEIDLADSNFQLMSLFDFEVPNRLDALAQKLRELQPVIEKARKGGDKADLLDAKKKLSEVLSELEELISIRA